MGELGAFTAAAATEPNTLHHQNSETDDQNLELDIYPLNCYYFGSKLAIPSKPHSSPHHLQRVKSKFVRFLFLFAIHTCLFSSHNYYFFGFCVCAY